MPENHRIIERDITRIGDPDGRTLYLRTPSGLVGVRAFHIADAGR